MILEKLRIRDPWIKIKVYKYNSMATWMNFVVQKHYIFHLADVKVI